MIEFGIKLGVPIKVKVGLRETADEVRERLSWRLFAIQVHLGRWSPLPLRLIVGYGFMAHGYAKIVKHPENFAAIPSFAQRTRSALHGVGNDCD